MDNAKFDLLNNQNEREIIMNEERLDVLDKVKKLVFMKCTEYMTTKQVADYYEVPESTINGVITRNREELIKNGFNKYSKDEILRMFYRNKHSVNNVKQERTRCIVTIEGEDIIINNTGLNLFNKRSILNVGMLLEESPIAEEVRTLLLDNHEQLNNIHKKLDNGEEITKEDIDKSNNEDRRFYVYEHIRKDNNTCFYVGKGTGGRAYDLDRGNFHNGVCKEYGCIVKIIKDGLTEKEAFALERERIEDYVITFGYGIPIDGYRDYSNNYLTNFTWGGEGASGVNPWNKGKKGIFHHTEETKEKMRGEKNPMFGKNPLANKTPEEIEKIKRKISKKAKGRKHSEEQNKKISEAIKGEKNGMWGKPAPNRSKVMCITTGENFDCIKDAAEKYNIYCTSISHCCNGKYKHAGKLKDGTKLQWKYLEDDDDLKAV